MGRSEDYLDSLLDSLNEPNEAEASELDINSLLDEIDNEDIPEEMSVVTEAPEKRTPETEASYLDAFEKEIAGEFGNDTESFLREFEADLGIGDAEDSFVFDASEPKVSSDESNEDMFGSLDDIINSADAEVSEEVAASSDIDVADILNSIEPEETEEVSPVTEASEASAEPSAPSASPSEEEEEEDFISDIDDGNESETSSLEPQEQPEESGEAPSSEGENEENISQDEILDIGDLLDSIDEEGNLSESEMETNPGEAVDEDAPSGDLNQGEAAKSGDDKEKEENKEEEGKKKKPGFLAKLIAILFSTGEEKEGEETEEPKEEEASPIDEEPAIDKKQAKKEEKERKKKEKEEAKKKAKEEKDKKAKEKPPKAPKQKKPKVPDKSPKIPLIAILAFILLSISMVVLWFVAQKTISHALFINGAKSSFDHQEYMASYQKLSGLEEYSEEELILYNRAKIMAMLEYRIKAYEQYVERDEQINAIDALVRGSVYYNAHKREATEMGIPSEYDELGRTINEKLSTVYGLSEQDAKDLMALRERKTYTRELYRVLEREGLWSFEKR